MHNKISHVSYIETNILLSVDIYIQIDSMDTKARRNDDVSLFCRAKDTKAQKT